MSTIAIAEFKLEFLSNIHSGYGADFAKFAKGLRAKEKKSINLETKNAQGELKPSVLVSSFRGVFRNASAFLLEKIGREISPPKNMITCDYLKEKGSWSKPNCPVCQVYGGPYREGQSDTQKKGNRSKSKVTFTFDGGNALQSSTTKEVYEFANVTVRKRDENYKIRERTEKENPLEVGGLDTVSLSPVLRITFDPFDDFSMALICLSADLISSGFFRIGRFISRGYGVVRLSPMIFCKATPYKLLMGNVQSIDCSDFTSGYKLAQEILKKEPLDVLVGYSEGCV